MQTLRSKLCNWSINIQEKEILSYVKYYSKNNVHTILDFFTQGDF